MKFIKVLLMISVLSFLVACNSSSEKLYILNWGEYLDPNLVSEFEAENNVKIVYEEVNSNEAMYSKITMQASPYDIAFPSEYMIAKMANEDLLVDIDVNKLSNYSNVDESYYNLTSLEPTTFIPYFTGSVGIMYNKDLVDEADLTSWDILWNEDYKNQIYMYDSIRDTIGVGALHNGYSLNTTDEQELAVIEKDLSKQASLVRGYGTDDIKNLIIAGDGALGVVYNGDYLYAYNEAIANEQDINFGYFVPNLGTNIWVDGMVIPNTSKNQELAHQFLDFMMDTKNAKANALYVGYPTTQQAVYDELVAADPNYYESNLAYMLDDERFNNSEIYTDLDPKTLQKYSDIYIRIKK